ncbi:MAG: tetratricopeptide repeat protein, partial [Vicingaceae bacterium]|nr:tetratricopeptide repeat protein [Vicingaceae bacterium]
FSFQSFGKKDDIESFIISLEEKNDSFIADTLFQIGRSNYFENNHKNSIKYLKEATKYYLKTNNQVGVISSINIIGHNYLKQEIYDNALKNYLVSLKLSKRIKNNTETARALNCIGRHSSHLKNYDKALNYYLQSLQLINNLDSNIEMKARSLNNIGMTYGYLKNVDKSLEYFNKSLPLRIELGDQQNLSILYNNIGYAYLLKEEYEKALEQFNLTLKISEEIKDTIGSTFVLLNIAEIHIIEKNHAKAIPVLLKGLELSQTLASEKQANMLSSDSYKFLAEAYEEIGNIKNSLLYYKKYNVIKEKLHQKEYENKLKNTELLNSLNLKEQKINELNNENKVKKLQLKSNYNFIISLLSLSIILGFFFIVFYFQKRNLKKANKNLALKNLEIVENENKLKLSAKKASLNEESQNKEAKTSKKYSNSPLSKEQKEILLNKILFQIEEEKIYLRDDLTLIMLSNTINTNKSYISQIINENFNINFSSFINEYRIKEARLLLSQKENWNITIESIANSVGFKSISAFNTAFKKYTGITPSYFLNTVKSK